MGCLAATRGGSEIRDTPVSLSEAVHFVHTRFSGFQSEVLGVLGNVSKNSANTSENCNNRPPYRQMSYVAYYNVWSTTDVLTCAAM